MIRKLKYIVLIILPLFLYGCVNNNSGTNNTTATNTPAPTSPSTTENVVLTWWSLFDTQEDVQPLIDAYQTAHPNVKIQFVHKEYNADFSKYVTELDEKITDTTLNQSPDIFPIYNTWAGKYEPLVSKAPSDIINESYFTDYYSIVKKDLYIKGAVALPQYMDAIAIIYNSQLLQDGGYTNVSTQWSEFKAMAEKLTKTNSTNKVTQAGFSAGFYDNVQFRFDVMNLLFMVNGVTMTDVTNSKAIFYNAGQKTNSDTAVNYYNDLGKKTWSKDLKKDIAEFLEGRLAMYAAPSWRIIDIINYNSQYNLNLKVEVAQVPGLANRTSYWPTYWGYTVSKISPKATEAWKFIKYINEKENLILFNKTVKENGRPIGIIYPRSTMNTDLTTDKYLGPYVLSLEKADNWYMRDGLKMEKAFNEFLAKPENLTKIGGLESSATSVITGN
jgi:ABC-type glycerol-3-phosphate transport system substrate-binding protein